MSKRVLTGLAVALVALGLLLVYQDSRTAAHKAAAAVAADAASQDVSASLADLKAYVAAHMGTSRTVTLSGSYARAQAASTAAAQAASNASAQVYADAQRACGGKTDSITQARCNQQYIAAHLTTATPTPVPEPKLADYQHRLTSPVWTPSLAGVVLAGALVAAVLALISSRRGNR
jgi:hypothetical protein